ncbi:hypothetical protein ACFWHT_10375 [Microbacterium sp. NPDC058342]|uniref:hypothetical protein n=1 Tax=Microbacterium sp. NPDC058342 TaxID=3346454 RepID=UPI0036571E42
MSTDGSEDAPLTRAQLRALRAAQSPAVSESEPAPEPEPGPAAEPEPAPAATPEPAPAAELEPAPAVPHGIPVPTAPIAVGLTVPTVPEQTDTAREHRPSGPGNRRFTLALLGVLGALVLVAGVLGVISLTQGPRVSQVQVDPAQAVESSGSRLILTANQSLATVEPEQVAVDPAVPFTVDTAGRSIGIRFTVPLDDETTYRVTVGGVVAAGGGPKSELATSFTTPATRILLLQRDADGDDKIFSTDLTGERARSVFQHPRIDDFRATSDLIVAAVEEENGSRLLVMNRDGSGQRELKLPGEGYVSSVQVSDRGGLVGYSYSDRDLTETSGRASVLVTQPLSGADEPRIVQIEDADASVAEWQFVPDSSSMLFIDFDGALSVEDPTTTNGVQSMGNAASILGVSRGTYTAIVQRTDASIVQLDLTSGDETPLPASEPDYGDADEIVPYPGGTLRHIVQRDEGGMPTGQAVVRVDDDGTAEIVSEVGGTDSIVQTCVSPSGQYAAVVVAPDLPNNDYDDLLLPLPVTLHTQLIDLAGERTLPTLSGFDVSWCGQAPQP